MSTPLPLSPHTALSEVLARPGISQGGERGRGPGVVWVGELRIADFSPARHYLNHRHYRSLTVATDTITLPLLPNVIVNLLLKPLSLLIVQ